MCGAIMLLIVSSVFAAAEVALNRITVQAVDFGSCSTVPSATEHSRPVPKRAQFFFPERLLRGRSGPAPATPTQLHFAEVAAVFPLIDPASKQGSVFLEVCSPAGRRRAHSALNGPRRPAWEPVRLFGLNALFGVCWDANTWIDAAWGGMRSSGLR